jgi:RNA polymerase sigma-70 factor (ECF subfamily)
VSETDAFLDFLHRIRAGEAEAAADLVRQFEPVIRIEVRRRLNDPYLNRVFDSTDVCQSVLASFFIRAAAGQYDLANAEDLLKLLVTMARRKLASQARRERTQARDNRRTTHDPRVLESLAVGPAPDRLAVGRELLEKFRSLLTEDERRLADMRAGGLTWPEVAAAVGGQAQARRRQLDRAVARASRELGLEDDEDE